MTLTLGETNWDMKWPTITIWIVKYMADEEGRKWDVVGIYDNENEAKAAANTSYHRRESITVFKEGPFKGVKPEDLFSLKRYPIDKAMQDLEMEKQVKAKLTPSEYAWLKGRA